MRFTSALTGALALAGSAFAAPVGEIETRGAAITDLIILQFALTLEHLENVFYKGALKKFTAADFAAAGYPDPYYTDLEYVAFDEQTHVVALEAAIKSLGATPVAACKYSFPYTDVPSFIALAQDLESGGVSAYSGAAALIKSSYYTTVAASILSVEALHTSFWRFAEDLVPFANPFETPLAANLVYTIASQFIVHCPPSNPPLPFTAFPYLTSTATAPLAIGATATFTATGKIAAGSYVTFINGLAIASVEGTIKGKTISAAIPDAVVGGQTYVIVTSSDISGDFTAYTDSAVEYGPAIIEVLPAPPAINFHILK